LVRERAERGADERCKQVDPEGCKLARDERRAEPAPLTGPPTSAPSDTAPPMARAAASPTARVSVATAMITSIRKKVRTTSQRKAWRSEPEGSVAPTFATSPSDARRSKAAPTAPPTWAAQ
jgi:hypothetical protein